MKMLNFLWIAIAFFCVAQATSQEKGILLTHSEDGKSVFIKEGKRVRVMLESRRKLNGRYTVVNDSVIKIRKHIIPIDTIVKIKKNPLVHTLVNAAVLFMPTAYALAVTLYAGADYLTLSFLGANGLIVPSVNVLPGYRPDKGWDIHIIDN